MLFEIIIILIILCILILLIYMLKALYEILFEIEQTNHNVKVIKKVIDDTLKNF